MGADSVLVNAAMKLGMSRVPGDTSEIFNKQYEGLIAYHKAKSEATVEAVKGGAIIARKGIDAIGTAVAKGKAKKAKNKSIKAAGTDQDAIDAAETKYDEDLQTIKENKLGKKARLKGAADILYGSGKKEGKDKQTDRDADLQLYKDKLEAKRESNIAATETLLQQANENNEDEEEDVFETSPNLGYKKGQLGGKKEGLSLSSFRKSSPSKKLSPFKQQEKKETKTVKKDNSELSTTRPEPVQSTTPTAMEMNNTMEQMVTDLAVDGITKASDHYSRGGGMNDAHFDAADLVMTNMKNDIYNIINQKSISTEDKKRKSKLQKDADLFRKSLVDVKGLVITTTQAYAENHVNTELSFKGFPNEQMLVKQVMDPNADLSKLGIKASWQDGELYYDYGDSQMFREYASNTNIEIDEKAPEAQPTKRIAASKLFGMAVLKDLKTENDINGVVNRAGEDAIATLGTTNKIINADFSRVEDSIKNDFRNIFEAKDANLQDVFTRDIMIGKTKRNYKKDLLANPEINTLTYADLGLTDSIDKNGDGVLSSDELTDNDKAVIIETLTNPRTSGQKEAAILEAERYFTGFAMQEFNHMKDINKPEKSNDMFAQTKGSNKTAEDYLKEIS